MCCIFNPTDLHFQKFPLPAQAWNEAQTQNVAVSTVPSAWAFVLIFFSLRLSPIYFCQAFFFFSFFHTENSSGSPWLLISEVYKQ